VKVYVILCGRYRKIGFAKDAQRRLKDIATVCPEPASLEYTVDAVGGQAIWVEARAHLFLAEHRYRGEWFVVSAVQAKAAVDRALDESVSVTGLERARMLLRRGPMAGIGGGRPTKFGAPGSARREMLFELWDSDITNAEFEQVAGVSSRRAREIFGERPALKGRPVRKGN
jgi:hypothetical protein